MPTPKSRLRLVIDEIIEDGQPHTVEELSGRINGLVILPGAAAREAERHRRARSECVQRTRPVSTDRVIAIGRRVLIRETLENMVKGGLVVRIAPATYQRSTSSSDCHEDVLRQSGQS
jgi:hypothetical protein